MAPRFGTEERRARLARRHRLAPETRVDDVAALTAGVVALHSSDPVSVHLSAAARLRTPSIEAVEAALYDDRAVVRHHAMRRTLWVMTPDVLRAAHAACTVSIARTERARTEKLLADNGVEGDASAWLDRARDRVLEVLARYGEATTRQLGEAVPELRHPLQLAAGKRYAATVAAHTRVMLLLGFEGQVVRTRPTGTWINGQYRWAPMADWVDGGIGTLTAREAATVLAGHWLRAFGPGTLDDLRWWAGWAVRTARQALADAGAVEVPLADGSTGWVAADDTEPDEPTDHWVALLPALDPTTMGWKERRWYLGDHGSHLFDRNGNAGPTVWVDGRVVGGWAQRPDGTIAVGLLEGVDRRAQRAIGALARRWEVLVADTRFTVRFPAPLQATLLGGNPT